MTPPAPATRLVVVPGLGLDARSWSPVMRRLTMPVEVRVLPGYGRRARRGVDLSPAVLGGLLGEELRDGPPTVLAGHSSGSQVAAHAVRAAGTAVLGLVLVGPSTDPRAATWPALAGRWLRTAAHEDPRQVPALLRQYAGTGLGTMARAMEVARHDELPAALRACGVPVLVVRGPDDRICPQDWAGSLSPRCTTLPAGAHMVPITHGAAVADVLADFVTSLEAQPHR